VLEWALIVVAGNLGYYIARQAGAPPKRALVALGLAWLGVLLPVLQEATAPPTDPAVSMLASIGMTCIPFVASAWLLVALEKDDPWSALENDPWPMIQRTLIASFVGLVTLPLVAILAIWMSCSLGLGCI